MNKCDIRIPGHHIWNPEFLVPYFVIFHTSGLKLLIILTENIMVKYYF